jgi:hypothetical protein
LLRSIQRLTSPSTLFAVAWIVYFIWFAAGVSMLIYGRAERDCVISVKWILMLRVASAWLAIRHAYWQTHSEIDLQPYLDKAQHLIWFSMIAFNSAWLVMDADDASKCASSSPTAYYTVIVMFYITLAWMLTAMTLHMLINSTYVGNGVAAVIMKAILKHMQVGWVLSGPLDTPTALNSLELEYLPTVKYHRGMFGRINSEEDEPTCAICMCPYEEGEEIRQLNCQHHFGKLCIDSWLKIRSSCPLCIAPVLLLSGNNNNNTANANAVNPNFMNQGQLQQQATPNRMNVDRQV